LKKQTTAIKRYTNGTRDTIHAPPTDNGHVSGQYAKLDPDGIAAPGTRLRQGDIFVNKHSPVNTSDTKASGLQLPGAGGGAGNSYETKPTAARLKDAYDMVIEQVLLTTNHESNMVVKTLLRDVRRPELGDKFSSRHGQKGVCRIIC
jgi:DNA-directed RNA polymerase III subunit RPC2